jgi:hypothetical protein
MQHDIPDDVNGDVLRRLVADGDNLSVPRTIDFQIIIPDEKSAVRFAEVVSSKFGSVKIKLFEEGKPGLAWDVTGSRMMHPDHKEITEVEMFLEDAAAPFGGENDGWGCFAVED